MPDEEDYTDPDVLAYYKYGWPNAFAAGRASAIADVFGSWLAADSYGRTEAHSELATAIGRGDYDNCEDSDEAAGIAADISLDFIEQSLREELRDA
jgi:hypothetical protein